MNLFFVIHFLHRIIDDEHFPQGNWWRKTRIICQFSILSLLCWNFYEKWNLWEYMKFERIFVRILIRYSGRVNFWSAKFLNQICATRFESFERLWQGRADDTDARQGTVGSSTNGREWGARVISRARDHRVPADEARLKKLESQMSPATYKFVRAPQPRRRKILNFPRRGYRRRWISPTVEFIYLWMSEFQRVGIKAIYYLLGR